MNVKTADSYKIDINEWNQTLQLRLYWPIRASRTDSYRDQKMKMHQPLRAPEGRDREKEKNMYQLQVYKTLSRYRSDKLSHINNWLIIIYYD